MSQIEDAIELISQVLANHEARITGLEEIEQPLPEKEQIEIPQLPKPDDEELEDEEKKPGRHEPHDSRARMVRDVSADMELLIHGQEPAWFRGDRPVPMHEDAPLYAMMMGRPARHKVTEPLVAADDALLAEVDAFLRR